MSKFKPYPHSIIPQGGNVPHLPILVMLMMLVIFSLTHIGLGIYTGAALVDWHLWLGILTKGLWFDLSVIAILIAMICLYEAALPNEWRASRWHGLLRRSSLWFVIAADHCASVAGKSKLPTESYHIPLIFYAPALIKPGTYSPMVSQIDLAPTIIDVLREKGADLYFGRSFYEPGKNLGRVFISNYQELGYYHNDVLTILSPKKKAASFSVNPKTYATTPTTLDAQGLKETIAYYQTASRAFKKGALRAPGL